MSDNQLWSDEQLDEALARCQEACAAYNAPEEIRPGLSLCAPGRVTRAMHIANQQPKTMWPKLEAEIKRLSAEADALMTTWMEAERDYRELCKQAGVEPSTVFPVERCECEGCTLAQDAIEAAERRPALPKAQWSTHTSLVEAQTVYANLERFYDLALGVDRQQGLFVLVAPPRRAKSAQ